MLLNRLLLSPDPGGEGSPATPPANPPGNPAPAAPPPAAPPAAAAVLTGSKTEREVSLETELEKERGSHSKTANEKKQREMRIAELEDELHKLKAAPAKGQSRSAFDISGFFED